MARETTIARISRFSGVGVWSDFKASRGTAELAPKSVVYGYNGSGKTTLSRIFSSLETGVISPRLGDNAQFTIHFSDDSLASESDLNSPLGKHLLVFNTDFIEKNLRWDDSTAEPIFYLDQSSIELVDELKAEEEGRRNLSDRLMETRSSVEETEAELRAKRTSIGRAVRQAWGDTQRFDARNVERAYEGTVFEESCELSDEAIAPLRQIIEQPEPLPKLNYPYQLPSDLWGALENCRSLVERGFTATVLEDLREHPDMLPWVASGHRYHADRELQTCLLCGQALDSDRQKALEDQFGQSWEAQEAQIQSAIELCASQGQEVRAAIQSLPPSTAIQPSLRTRYTRVKEDFAAGLMEVENAIGAAQEQLALRRGRPFASLSLSESLRLFGKERWSEIKGSVQEEFFRVLQEHNDSFNNFDAHRSDAIRKIRDHLLFEHQADYRSLEASVCGGKRSLAELDIQLGQRTEKCEKLSNQLRQHGPAASKLSELIGEYLGHRSIRLKTKDRGYQVIRSDGQAAEHLSEGEKTAIAFCFFLTQFEAEGRDRRKLVVIVDDPVSSLDSTAQSYAFGLLKKYTKRVAQAILLTHNLQLMHMAKRQFFQGHNYEENEVPHGLLQIDCTERSGEGRQSRLRMMHPLLARYDTEYQYLFHLVAEADRTGDSPFIFVLPNAMRKLLEIFSAFAAPNKVGFAQALQDSASDLKRIDSAEMTALERLCQIESHGDIEDVTTLSPMTIEESYRAASGALKYIRERDRKHFEAMVALVQGVE